MLQHLSITSLALAGMTCLADAQVTISEICPSNIDVILDEDGDSSDWIEPQRRNERSRPDGLAPL